MAKVLVKIRKVYIVDIISKLYEVEISSDCDKMKDDRNIDLWSCDYLKQLEGGSNAGSIKVAN